MTLHPIRAPRALALSLAVGCAVLAGGCGIGSGAERSGDGATLAVTRDSGAQRITEKSVSTVREGDTVMRFLQGSARVKTRYGGGFVQSVDGVAGTGDRDWFYYVNGLLGSKGANEYTLRAGDRVQWDYRLWKPFGEVKAIVGQFPEPFVNGLDGKKFPVRVECADAGGAPCRQVKDQLRAAGVTASGSALGTQGTQNVARIVVGDWAAIRRLPTVRAIEQGPRASKVFARFSAAGDLSVLDDRGRTARRLGRDAGLVAALRPTDMQLVWVVTGGQEAGVERAAASLTSTRLRDAFALVTPASGRPLGVPVKGGS